MTKVFKRLPRLAGLVLGCIETDGWKIIFVKPHFQDINDLCTFAMLQTHNVSKTRRKLSDVGNPDPYSPARELFSKICSWNNTDLQPSKWLHRRRKLVEIHVRTHHLFLLDRSSWPYTLKIVNAKEQHFGDTSLSASWISSRTLIDAWRSGQKGIVSIRYRIGRISASKFKCASGHCKQALETAENARLKVSKRNAHRFIHQ